MHNNSTPWVEGRPESRPEAGESRVTRLLVYVDARRLPRLDVVVFDEINAGVSTE
jgi:hypothetical protein